MKFAVYIGGLLGLGLLIALVVRSDSAALLQTLALGGWPLLGLIPYRLVFFFLYASGWLALLHPYDPAGRATLGYVLWVTTVREAIDRLLPVASVGGGVAGVRLMYWRGLPIAAVSATIVVEVLLTLIVLYLFTALGLFLLFDVSRELDYRHLLLLLLIGLLIPATTALLLRYGSVFQRLEGFLRPLVGQSALSDGAAALDRELRSCLHRGKPLLIAGTLQLAAMVCGSFEVWFALRLFGHPVSVTVAVILESMTQALRHFAFFIPAGLGVQEAGLVLFGQTLGISSELALAVSMAKRVREVACGLPALASWQFLEGRRLRAAA